MFLFLACWLIGTATSAQPSPAGAGATLTKARAALQAGRAGEAVELADAVLTSRPADTEALGIKVDALLSQDTRLKALDAYDAWFKASRREDLAIAGRIARAELEALAKQDVAGIEVEAIAALAADGGTVARTRLSQVAWATPPTTKSWPAVVALARQGDTRAGERVLRAARESSGSGKVEALRAIGIAKVAGADQILREALATRDAMLQSGAADAVAALGLETLTADLQKVAESGEQFARFTAAAALAQLGAPGGESLIQSGISSPAPDVKLRSAVALRARGTKDWVDQIRPLLASPDGLTRFQAAEMLLEVDRPAASKVLAAGTTDPNVAIRGEVARILVGDPTLDLAELRRLLRDGAPLVRLQTARALVERARKEPTRPPTRK